MSARRCNRPRVVMVVLNDVTGDSRVQKSAAVVRDAGYDVTVVGRSATPDRSDEMVDGVRQIRVPIEGTVNRHIKTMRSILQAADAQDDGRDPPQRALGYLLRARRRAMDIARIRGELDAGARGPKARPVRAVRWARILALRSLMRRDRRRAAALRKRAERPQRLRRSPVHQPAPVRWRDELPAISDFELAYLPVILELEPDLIHAHDHSALAIAEHATLLARADRGDVKLLYDAHEYVAGVPYDDERVRTAWIELEQEHIHTADAVITVSPVLSQTLRREYGLPRTPDVVLNAPIAAAFDPQSPYSVRDAAGLRAGVPLLVYSGGVKRQRGVETLVRALPYLEGVHAAVVARADSSAVSALQDLAESVGCGDRLHIVPFVPPDLVSSYLRTADIGVHTILSSGNADIALPNKMFEYFHAGLPMVVSDVAAMAGFTKSHGTGEVFPAGDHRALAAACRQVLSDLDRYRAPLRDADFLRCYSWERQAATLIDVYRRLLPVEACRA